jgi:hypothetical protein
MLLLTSLSEANTEWWLTASEILLLASAVVLTIGLVGEWPDSESWKSRVWYKLGLELINS